MWLDHSQGDTVNRIHRNRWPLSPTDPQDLTRVRIQPATEDELLLFAGRTVINHQLHICLATIRVPTLEDTRPIRVVFVDGAENLRQLHLEVG